MNKKLVTIVALMAAFATTAGVYRHDVPAKKYKDLAAQKQFDCVGMVLQADNKEKRGSCVLIGKKYVLSAAHVFMETEYRKDTLYIDKQGKAVPKEEAQGNIVVNQPVSKRPGKADFYQFRFGDKLYTGKKIKIYPCYLDTTQKFCGDIALIELEEEVKEIEPARINRKFDELHAEITGVGFGASGPANKPEDVSLYNEKIAGQNTVDEFDGTIIEGMPSLLTWDFDHPTRTDCNRTGSAKPLPLEYKENGGDSGGGIFRKTNTGWELIGVVTGGPKAGIEVDRLLKTGYYGHISQHVRVSVFANWIDNTLAEFGAPVMGVDMQLK